MNGEKRKCCAVFIGVNKDFARGSKNWMRRLNLFHGVELHCIFPEKLVDFLKEHKLELVAHTHPDWGIIIPSKDDRNFLKRIGQKKSIIISYITGMELQFNSNEFDDIM